MTDEEKLVDRAVGRTGTNAVLFGTLWDALTELMGSAACATLLRRAAKRASAKAPDLARLTIARDRFEYRYAVPASWQSDDSTHAFCELVRELRPLLIELTGQVVVRRLRAIPALEVCGDLLRDGEP